MNCPSHFLPVRFPSEQELLFMPQWLCTLCSFHSLSHTSSNKIYSRKMIRRKQNDVCCARENNAIAWNERKTKGVSWRKKFSLSRECPKVFLSSSSPNFMLWHRAPVFMAWKEKKIRSHNDDQARRLNHFLAWSHFYLASGSGDWRRKRLFLLGEKTESISHYCSQERKNNALIAPIHANKSSSLNCSKNRKVLFSSLSISILVLRSIRNKGPSLVLREFCGLYFASFFQTRNPAIKTRAPLTFSSLFSPL